MQPEPLHVVHGPSKAGNLQLASIARTCIHLAYRQRAADLTASAITVPDTDETVATGAAVQAAVVAGGGDHAEIARRWGLGSGTTVEPAHDVTGVRARYAHSLRAVTGGPA